MKVSELHLRVIENKDWATIFFIVSLLLIVLLKSAFENRFNEFLRLVVSDRYLKIYKETSFLITGFNILLFFINLISLSFFIQLILDHYGYGSKLDWILFIQIFTFLGIFILSKFLLEKIIGVTFDIEGLMDQFNLHKVSFRTLIGLFLLPITIVLYYNNYTTNGVIITIIIILLVINLLTYLFSLKNYQSLILSKLFYFILYLCALEIAPYYFIYYLITKNIAH